MDTMLITSMIFQFISNEIWVCFYQLFSLTCKHEVHKNKPYTWIGWSHNFSNFVSLGANPSEQAHNKLLQ